MEKRERRKGEIAAEQSCRSHTAFSRANHGDLYMSYQIACGSDIRNAMHDFIVHCHTGIWKMPPRLGGSDETRVGGSFKILRLSDGYAPAARKNTGALHLVWRIASV